MEKSCLGNAFEQGITFANIHMEVPINLLGVKGIVQAEKSPRA